MAAPRATKHNTQTLRVGIIGARIGRSHLLAYQKTPNVEVVAVCDLDEERARQLVELSGCGAPVFADYRAMLESAHLDAVSICLPNALHFPVALDCLAAGVHILCEKPLATSAADAQQIADEAARENLKVMVAQVVRFRADSQWLKTRVLAGDLGAVYYARTGWLRKRGIPGFGTWFTNKAQSGGGPLIDIGVHMLDLAWWLCGCPKPLTASGSTFAAFGPRGLGAGEKTPDASTRNSAERVGENVKYDVEDLAVGLIRCEGGLTINLEVSWALNNRQDRQWCQIFGDLGGGAWGEAALFHDVGGAPTALTPELSKTDHWQNEIGHFIDAIRGDTAPDPDAAQGVTMMKMLDALYASAAAGHEIEIQ